MIKLVYCFCTGPRVAPPVDEGWTAVPTKTTRVPIDPTKLKLTKVFIFESNFDFE